jgi:hypothetical protein
LEQSRRGDRGIGPERPALLSLAEHGETPTVDVATLTFKEAEVLG